MTTDGPNQKIAEWIKKKKMKAIKITSELSVNDFADRVHQNAKDHGFHSPFESLDKLIANQCCNEHSEVSKLWDAYRAGTFNLPCDKAEKMAALGLPALTCAEEEYADIIIRALDMCRRLEIDIARALQIKHAYNVTRPFKHRKKN